MSLPRYRIPAKARAMLRERGATVAKLSEQSGVPQTRVLRALSGHPKAKAKDRLRLTRLLTMDEYAAIGWDVVAESFPVEQFQHIPMTERPSQTPLPAVEPGLEAPEGSGTGGHKPLMRNRSAAIARAPATGLLPATLS